MIKVKASEVAMAKIVPQFDQTREDSDKPVNQIQIENIYSSICYHVGKWGEKN